MGVERGAILSTKTEAAGMVQGRGNDPLARIARRPKQRPAASLFDKCLALARLSEHFRSGTRADAGL